MVVLHRVLMLKLLYPHQDWNWFACMISRSNSVCSLQSPFLVIICEGKPRSTACAISPKRGQNSRSDGHHSLRLAKTQSDYDCQQRELRFLWNAIKHEHRNNGFPIHFRHDTCPLTALLIILQALLPHSSVPVSVIVKRCGILRTSSEYAKSKVTNTALFIRLHSFDH